MFGGKRKMINEFGVSYSGVAIIMGLCLFLGFLIGKMSEYVKDLEEKQK